MKNNRSNQKKEDRRQKTFKNQIATKIKRGKGNQMKQINLSIQMNNSNNSTSKDNNIWQVLSLQKPLPKRKKINQLKNYQNSNNNINYYHKTPCQI